MKIMILGAGGIGSWLSFLLIHRQEVEKLLIIDNGFISESNLPYLFATNDILSLSKITILKSQLSLYDKENKIIVSCSDINNDNLEEGYDIIIDCLDRKYMHPKADYKLLIDGEYGAILINDNNIYEKKRNNYVFGFNPLYSIKLGLLFIDFLFLSENKISVLVDLKENGLYPLGDNKENETKI